MHGTMTVKKSVRAKGWMVPGSNAGTAKVFIASPKLPKQLWVQAVFYSVASGVLPQGKAAGG
jgi:hypothetical protein